jgi:hypothetical protein
MKAPKAPKAKHVPKVRKGRAGAPKKVSPKHSKIPKVKKLAKTVKKKVNLRGALHVAAKGIGFIPIVGGLAGGVLDQMTDKALAKKQKAQDEANDHIESMEAAQETKRETIRSTADDFIEEATGVIADKGGKIAGGFVKKTMDKFIGGLSPSVQEAAGDMGSEVMQNSLMSFFKKFWYIPVILLIGGCYAIFKPKKQFNNQRNSRR